MNGRVKAVQAIRGAVDELVWTVEVSQVGWGQEEIRLIGWEGDVAFLKQPVQANVGVGQRHHNPGLLLPVRWLPSNNDTQPLTRNSKLDLTFVTQVPMGALGRLEERRDGGVWHARLEGGFFILLAGHTTRGKEPQPAIIYQFTTTMSLVDDLRCETWEVPRDVWADVLRTLRREHRYMVEVAYPADQVPVDIHEALSKKLAEAQAAFDEGHHDDVARLVYVVHDWLNKHSAAMTERYGADVSKFVVGALKGLKSLANTERHGSEVEIIGRTDRALALHLLASTQTLVAVYFQGEKPSKAP